MEPPRFNSARRATISAISTPANTQVAEYYCRPDLKSAAVARLSSVNRSLEVAKSGVKRRNRQAIKIHGRQ